MKGSMTAAHAPTAEPCRAVAASLPPRRRALPAPPPRAAPQAGRQAALLAPLARRARRSSPSPRAPGSPGRWPHSFQSSPPPRQTARTPAVARGGKERSEGWAVERWAHAARASAGAAAAGAAAGGREGKGRAVQGTGQPTLSTAPGPPSSSATCSSFSTWSDGCGCKCSRRHALWGERRLKHAGCPWQALAPSLPAAPGLEMDSSAQLPGRLGLPRWSLRRGRPKTECCGPLLQVRR